ncbi:MAG: hypothetical protein D6790_09645 [Caldilineae bacterium]|nr:MAG: hypothetical protein D6790_09645 [Caldilineae bacterium]
MPDPSPFQEILRRLNLERLPSLERILDSMDPIAWTLLALLVGAVLLGVYFTLSTRFRFRPPDEVETSPDMLLNRLKQDPTILSPASIINRLGAEATLELLEFGDRMVSKSWRFKWSAVREDLLYLLSQQNAFAPIHVLARYYQSDDPAEPDSLRVRRTVLIHKLGQRRYLEPAEDGTPAQLWVHRHPAEQSGDLGFDGPTLWLDRDQDPPAQRGPVVEMDEIDFKTVEDATVNIRIQRTPTAGGGFRLRLEKRRKMWIVVDETIEWTL